MRASGRTAMASASGQTEAVLPSAKEEGKRGKIGLLAAAFSQLLGKAARDDQAKNRATIPTVTPTEATSSHGSIESIHGAEDKPSGDGAPAGLASAGASDKPRPRPSPIPYPARSTERPSSREHQAASDKVLTSAKSDGAKPAELKAHEGNPSSSAGRETSVGRGVVGTPATAMPEATTTVATAARATVETLATKAGVTASASKGVGEREGQKSESRATAERIPAQHGQNQPAAKGEASLSPSVAGPVKSTETSQTSAAGSVAVTPAKVTPTRSWVAAARYAQTADKTEPLQAQGPTAPQQSLPPGDSSPRVKGAKSVSPRAPETSPNQGVELQPAPGRAPQDAGLRNATPDAKTEATPGDQRTVDQRTGDAGLPKTDSPASSKRVVPPASTTAFPSHPAAEAERQAAGHPKRTALEPEAKSSLPQVASSPQVGQAQPAAQGPQASAPASTPPRHESAERSNDILLKSSRSQARSTVATLDPGRGKASEGNSPVEPTIRHSLSVTAQANARPSREDKPNTAAKGLGDQAQPLGAEPAPSDEEASGRVLHDETVDPRPAGSKDAQDRGTESNEQPRPTGPRSVELPILPRFVADTRTSVSNMATVATAGTPANAAPVVSTAPSATARLSIPSQQHQTKPAAASVFATPSDRPPPPAPHASPSSAAPATQQAPARQTIPSPSSAAPATQQAPARQNIPSPSSAGPATQQAPARQNIPSPSSAAPATQQAPARQNIPSPSSAAPATQQAPARQAAPSPSGVPVPSQQAAIPLRASAPSPTVTAPHQTAAPQRHIDSSSERPAPQRPTAPQPAPSATPTVQAAAPRQETPSPAPREATAQAATPRAPQAAKQSLPARGPELTAATAQTHTKLPATPSPHASEPSVAPAANAVPPIATPSSEATPPQRTSGAPRTKTEARPSYPATTPAQAEVPDQAKLAPLAHSPERGHRQAASASAPQTTNQARPSSPVSAPTAGPPAQSATDAVQTSPVGSSKPPLGQEDLEPPTVRARTKRAALNGGGDVPSTAAPASSNKDSDPAANAHQQSQPSAPAKTAAAPHMHSQQHTGAEPAIVSGRSATPESSPAQTAAPPAPSATEQAAQAAPVALPAAPPLPWLGTMSVAPAPNAVPSGGESLQVKPIAVEAASLYQRAAEDSGLAVTVLPHVAHLSLTSDDGNLSLHVRVRDGSADVNVGGSMAPIFESKAPEMRTVLAHQGLGLGSFAADQHGQGQHSQHHPEAAGSEVPHSNPAPTTRTRATAVESHATDEGRIHITA